MRDHDPELEEFKCFDLRVYAAAHGYKLGKGKDESSRGSSAMYHANGDKIIIKRETDGHYVYFSVKRDHNGTIIDLVRYLKGFSLSRARQELRPYLGRRVAAALPSFTPLPKVSKDLIAVAKEYERMEKTPAHSYLLWRGIPESVLTSPRFDGMVKMDRHGNAIFPHTNEKGLCGFEKKNRDFTGFASGGEKGLGSSNDFDDDDCIVFTESVIEFFSYAALFPEPRARYRSVGDELNPAQPDLIRKTIELMPAGSQVIAAMNNDETGHKLADVVRQAAIDTGRADLLFRIDEPSIGENDWNERLKPMKTRASVFPIARIN